MNDEMNHEMNDEQNDELNDETAQQDEQNYYAQQNDHLTRRVNCQFFNHD